MRCLPQVSVHSQERLESTFSPALLLSLGDLNSFLGDARAIIGADGPPNMQAWYGKDKPHAPMPPPSMEEQLAMKRDLTGRVPQKYLIQNLTGLTLCYWSGDPSASNVHTHYLCNGGEETLKVEPSDDWGTITSGTKAKTAIRFLRKVLHVRFQGNWMPIKRIVVNHIGKFSYMLVSPHDGLRVPLLVDISLKARTKIISVHSTVKVRNCSDATLHFRLKLPTLAAVGPASDGLHQESEGPAFKGPRPTKTNKCEHAAKQTLGTNVVDLGWHGYDGNCYLPVQSVVDGMLYVQARNYEESLRDVILLKPNIKDMENQQAWPFPLLLLAERRDEFVCSCL